MITTSRFAMRSVQRNELLQPQCPVYLHCSRICSDSRSGACFAQLRLVNRSDWAIRTVIVCIECLAADGTVRDTLREHFLVNCNALPHSVFGEEQLLALVHEPVEALRVTIERVLFSDGLCWRRLPEQRILTVREAGWKRCGCALPNPPEARYCLLCGRALGVQTPNTEAEAPFLVPEVLFDAPPEEPAEILPATEREAPAEEAPAQRPAPILRMPEAGAAPPAAVLTPPRRSVPKWSVLLLGALGMAALIAGLVLLTLQLHGIS